jgi:ABC-type dipeptide/oligopeptide/nickel transport system permease subunit
MAPPSCPPPPWRGRAFPCRPAPGAAPGGGCAGASSRWPAWPWSLAFIVLALFAPWIAPQDPIATSWGAIRKAPSAEHWFGTDEIGRDVLSRVIWGTRASLLAGVVSVSSRC